MVKEGTSKLLVRFHRLPAVVLRPEGTKTAEFDLVNTPRHNFLPEKSPINSLILL